jgi:hypothetical protein
MTELAPTADLTDEVAPLARSAWPTLADVQAELRLDYLQPDAGDEDVLQNGLDAAISYVTGRVRPSALVDELGALVVPDDVWQATVLYASRLYRRRDSLDGTIGWTDTGGVVRVGWRDADVENLLGRWAAIPL